MLTLTFLSANAPLTKTITPTETFPYPKIKALTSHVKQVASLQDFYNHLVQHGLNGHTLLKGSLKKQIKNESRAGLTDPNEPTSWFCIDIDGVNSQNVKHFIASAIPELAEFSYICQYSASYKIKTGLRAHLLFILDAPVNPNVIKEWVRFLNLRAHKQGLLTLNLSQHNLSLLYPIDISVNNNTTALFIAPPVFKDMADPLPTAQRYELIKNNHDLVDSTLLSRFDFSANRNNAQTIINQLRHTKGLPKKETKYKHNRTYGTLISNPDVCTVTEVRENADFIMLNLNGGDSWAYWHPKNNFEILYNFKDEPIAKLIDIAPDYYASLQPKKELNPDLVFFNNALSDKYMFGRIDGDLYTTSAKTKLFDWINENNLIPPEDGIIPTYSYIFDPKSKTRLDKKAKTFNSFSEPLLFKQPINTTAEDFDPTTTWPTIQQVIFHTLGSDTDHFQAFLSWLVYIMKKREQTQSAWVISGTHGTGKGLTLHHIVAPLFGRYCVTKQLTDLSDKFNEWMAFNLLAIFEEASQDSLSRLDRSVSKAKFLSYITESEQNIRRMNKAASRNEPVFINFIFTSNAVNVVSLTKDDRRYFVPPRQETPLASVLDLTDIDLRIKNELPAFAAWLTHQEISYRPGVVLHSKTKALIAEAGESTITQFFKALKTGELLDIIVLEPTDLTTVQLLKKAKYEKIMDRWIREWAGNGPFWESIEEIRIVYEFITGKSIPNVSFGRVATNNAMSSQVVRLAHCENKAKRAVLLELKLPESDKQRELNSRKVAHLDTHRQYKELLKHE